MEIIRLDHVGVAIEGVEEARKVFEDLLGLSPPKVEVVEEQRVRTYIYRVGDSKIELLESLDPQGPISRFLSKRGPGLHHVAFEVPSIDLALKELKSRGLPLLDEVPRRGVENSRIAFLDPRSTGRVLVELVEFPRGPPSPERGK